MLNSWTGDDKRNPNCPFPGSRFPAMQRSIHISGANNRIRSVVRDVDHISIIFDPKLLDLCQGHSYAGIQVLGHGRMQGVIVTFSRFSGFGFIQRRFAGLVGQMSCIVRELHEKGLLCGHLFLHPLVTGFGD